MLRADLSQCFLPWTFSSTKMDNERTNTHTHTHTVYMSITHTDKHIFIVHSVALGNQMGESDRDTKKEGIAER